ncbi:hypothetical protein CC80DRAFT_396781, partial [Byssothecium circinans]
RKLIIYCLKGYYQRRNVQYLCQKDNILLLNNFDELVKTAIAKLKKIVKRKNLLV